MLGRSVGGGHRGRRKADFRGSGWVSGIGRRVVAKYSMGNQTNSKFVEENSRKNFCFLEKRSSVLPRRLSENISHQLLLYDIQLWSITPGFNAIYKFAMSKSIVAIILLLLEAGTEKCQVAGQILCSVHFVHAIPN